MSIYKGLTRLLSTSSSSTQSIIINNNRCLYNSTNRYFSTTTTTTTVDYNAPLSATEILRKKLLYQSKERGMLENDLLLGTFATKHLHSFTDAQLKKYDIIIQQPDPDIYNWVLSKDIVPEELDNDVMKLLQHHCQNNPLGYYNSK
ncbi:DUF339 family protein [Cavenderia fasciculata]|uniref:Succinate dehydrogenase assembly factor 2, mitochondrial n=1 Tax=Cavenderia fasciculata TaxID=261658 RepID=F4PNN2_CACFS|nr:DUF339 family protein [Cavenderia fasciculata]EGG23085.1 DUF339 family protein [Cavenderia fasciculata]|eukprot:XP_004360936.1 DUF339 family protein [Cavenderia fasciculata]